MGITPDDLTIMMRETEFIAGAKGIIARDLSPVTAQGVFYGLKACFQTVFGNSSLHGRTIAVQGAGKVGYHLIKLLASEGAKLFVSDIDRARLERVQSEFGVKIVEPPEAIYALECDAFAPVRPGRGHQRSDAALCSTARSSPARPTISSKSRATAIGSMSSGFSMPRIM
jgi:glutamate dehydrogenase/leucine dehydrogenase